MEDRLRERERERDETSEEETREGGTRGGKTRGRRLRRESGRGGESTNEETNALRSKEHACGSTLEENVVKRNGDGMTKGTELWKYDEGRENCEEKERQSAAKFISYRN